MIQKNFGGLMTWHHTGKCNKLKQLFILEFIVWVPMMDFFSEGSRFVYKSTSLL